MRKLRRVDAETSIDALAGKSDAAHDLMLHDAASRACASATSSWSRPRQGSRRRQVSACLDILAAGTPVDAVRRCRGRTTARIEPFPGGSGAGRQFRHP